MKFKNDKEIELMVETRPTEAVAYIKGLQKTIETYKALLTGAGVNENLLPDYVDG